jgi:hypothetical protein
MNDRVFKSVRADGEFGTRARKQGTDTSFGNKIFICGGDLLVQGVSGECSAETDHRKWILIMGTEFILLRI